MPYLHALAHQVEERVAAALASDTLPSSHRGLQSLVETCVYAWLVPGGHLRGDERVLALVQRCVTRLRAQQGPGGLFESGDNVLSPPDSSFSVNGLARCLRLLRDLPPEQVDGLAPSADRLGTVLSATVDGLLGGGVHTPNHRWEAAAALAQLHDLLGDQRLLDRCQAWLAEGIDIQADGLYSERSPNYAVHVTNPSLLVLADLLHRPELREVVHRNLHAHASLCDAQGRLETIQSRRQDQRGPFGLGPFETQYRFFALTQGCPRCTSMARRAAALGGANPVLALADCLRWPELAAELPDLPAPPEQAGWQRLEPSGLAIWRAGDARLVARAAPDVAHLGRVASGVSGNPTFANFSSSQARVESLRLSREFFNTGPFRADRLELDGDEVVLRERVEARYYQPLDAASLHPDGAYEFSYEGRFAAAMSFSEREHDTIAMGTEIRLRPRPDGLDLSLAVTGPRVPLYLGVGVARGERHKVLVGPLDRASEPLAEADWGYNAGEAFTFLGGSDALANEIGLRLMGPGRFRYRITCS